VALLTSPLPSQRIINIGTGVVSTAVVVALLYYGRPFFVTVILSAMCAFMLDPAVKLVMRLRLPRPAATGVVVAVALAALYVVGVVIWAQVSKLAQDLPTYTTRVSQLLDKTSAKLEELENTTIESIIPRRLREQQQEIQQKPQEAAKARRRRAGLSTPTTPEPPQVQEVRIKTEPRPAIAVVYNYAAHYFRAMLMASFVPFLVYFMLSWSDHFSRSITHLFRGEQRYSVEKSWGDVAEATRAFIIGNVVLGIFLSLVSAIIFFFLKVPYWPLIGCISGFLSLLPYVGLPLAILPPVIAALAIPNKFTVILTIAAATGGLHVLASNFFYPKIVGRHVHLNPLVITLALMFWTLLWGGVGLVLAVPITAAIKAVCENVKSLQPVAKILGD
jgi:predicted PurR-regulated permease PerM